MQARHQLLASLDRFIHRVNQLQLGDYSKASSLLEDIRQFSHQNDKFLVNPNRLSFRFIHQSFRKSETALLDKKKSYYWQQAMEILRRDLQNMKVENIFHIRM